MSKHTPGPWNCMRASAAGREIITSEVSPVDVCVLSHRNKSAAEIDANARLIAAAPELLEVLRILVEHRSRCFIPEEADFPHLANWTERACAAIAKATAG